LRLSHLSAPAFAAFGLQAHLHTPGLFTHSASACCSSLQPGRAPHSTQQLQQLLAATAPIRWALDTGSGFPEHVTPHQAAAALLLLLQQLPDSLMPPDVSAVLVHCVPPVPSAMLSDAMSVAEWATLRHVLVLWRRALAPEVAASNGLTTFGLAGVLAEHVFGDTAAAGESSESYVRTLVWPAACRPGACCMHVLLLLSHCDAYATHGQVPDSWCRPASAVFHVATVAVAPEVAANRVAFMMALLDPQAAAPGSSQQPAAAPAGQPQLQAPSAPAHQRGTSAVVQPAAQHPSESSI
jgi:hypothetical protein